MCLPWDIITLIEGDFVSFCVCFVCFIATVLVALVFAWTLLGFDLEGRKEDGAEGFPAALQIVASLEAAATGAEPFRTVEVSDRVRSGAAVACIARGIRCLGRQAGMETLRISNCPRLTLDDIRNLATAASPSSGLLLRSFEVLWCPQLRNTLVQELHAAGIIGAEGTLIQLTMSDCGLDAIGVGELANVCWQQDAAMEGASPSWPLRALAMPRGPSLSALQLSGNQLSGAGRALETLLALPCLEELGLQRCSLLTEDVTVVAKALPLSSLRRLDLGYNDLASQEVSVLAAALSAAAPLLWLGLEGNSIGRGAALQSLGHAWGPRPVDGLRLNDNLLSESELISFLQMLPGRVNTVFAARHRNSAKKLRFASAFGSACRVGCDCDGRGEVM